MEAPEKIYMPTELLSEEWTRHINGQDIEYTRTDAFIEKAKKWFEEQTSYIDIDGDYHWDENWFDDFFKAMKL